DALLVGLAQCLALVPGTSRSGATIIGGLFVGLSRKAAAEFSFFLAIPTMFAATVYDVYKNHELFRLEDVALLATGFVAAFIAAFFSVRALVAFISRHSFIPFAWYRIGFGLLVLWTACAGWVDWSGGFLAARVSALIPRQAVIAPAAHGVALARFVLVAFEAFQHVVDVGVTQLGGQRRRGVGARTAAADEQQRRRLVRHFVL